MPTSPEPNAHGVVGACANHPGRPGTHLRADGTLRCQPCHDNPRVVAWPVARTGSVCGCGQPIRAGDRYAVLDTLPPTSCCEQCTDS